MFLEQCGRLRQLLFALYVFHIRPYGIAYSLLCYRAVTLWQVSAHCYNGECRSHETQCRVLWGDNTVLCGISGCIDGNTGGLASRNCGYDDTTDTYLPCDSRYWNYGTGISIMIAFSYVYITVHYQLPGEFKK